MYFKTLAVMALFTLLGLGGCASGNLAGLSSDPMNSAFVHKNGDYGPMTPDQYRKVVQVVASCRKDVDRQTASLAEVMATNAVVDAAAGYAGGSVGYRTEAGIVHARLAKNAVPGVAAFDGIINAAGGAASGVKIKAASNAALVGNCANGDLHDPLTARGMSGIHVYGSAIRVNNSSKELPKWVVRTPNLDARVQPADTHEPDPQN